jgi:hypothetical protein
LVALWTTGPALIKFWTHGEVQVTRVFVLFLASHSVINLILVGPVAVDMALNRHGAILRVLFGSSIISLAFWIAFQHLITPVIGAGLLLCIPEIVVAFYVLVRAPLNFADFNDKSI